jgi:hypothetical protein
VDGELLYRAGGRRGDRLQTLALLGLLELLIECGRLGLGVGELLQAVALELFFRLRLLTLDRGDLRLRFREMRLCRIAVPLHLDQGLLDGQHLHLLGQALLQQ